MRFLVRIRRCLATLMLAIPILLCGDGATEAGSMGHYLAVKKEEGRRFTIVGLGDSNTELNWTSRGHLNWLGLVSAALFESGCAKRVVTINSGISGDTATGALERLERDVLAHKPDLVIVCFGTNDCLYSNIAPEKTKESLHEIIRRIRASGEVSILLRTPVPIWNKETNAPESIACVEEVVSNIRKVAEEEGVTLVDHYKLWTETNPPSDLGALFYDRLHPNEVGHRRLYEELTDVLDLPKKLRWE